MKAMRIRVLPSDVQERTFELRGVIPMRMDLTEAIEMVKAGTIHAQENPFDNTVNSHGVHKFHHFHTVTNHFYISRPIFVHWADVRCVAWGFAAGCAQGGRRRQSGCNAGLLLKRTSRRRRQAILASQGCEILELTEDEHAQFKRAVEPLWADARKQFGKEMFELMPG